MLLQVVTVYDGADAEIWLSGEMDHSTIDEFRRHLVGALARLPRRVVINMRGLAFMDSAGIGELIRARRLLASRDRELVIRDANESITRILETMGLHLIVRFEVSHDQGAADARP